MATNLKEIKERWEDLPELPWYSVAVGTLSYQIYSAEGVEIAEVSDAIDVTDDRDQAEEDVRSRADALAEAPFDIRFLYNTVIEMAETLRRAHRCLELLHNYTSEDAAVMTKIEELIGKEEK